MGSGHSPGTEKNQSKHHQKLIVKQRMLQEIKV